MNLVNAGGSFDRYESALSLLNSSNITIEQALKMMSVYDRMCYEYFYGPRPQNTDSLGVIQAKIRLDSGEIIEVAGSPFEDGFKTDFFPGEFYRRDQVVGYQITYPA